MKYDLKKRVFLLKKYYQTGSIWAVQVAYRSEFKTKIAPGHQIIRNIVKSFEKNGSVVSTRSKRQEPSRKREDAKTHGDGF